MGGRSTSGNGALIVQLNRKRYAILSAALFVAYVVAAKIGIELRVAEGLITPVWAPTGIALAALVLNGRGLWPAVALGAFVANAISGASIPEAASIAVGNTLEAVVGATLLLQVGFRPALDRVRDVLALIGLGAFLSTMIAATNGVTTLVVSGDIDGSDYWSSWLLWWVGDAMGNLVVAPLLLVLAQRPWRRLTRPHQIEALLMLAVLTALSSLVFLAGYWRYPHLLFPLLIWAALRFHQLGATVGSFVVTGIAVAGAVEGTTPIGKGSTTEVVQILEGLSAGTAVSLLILGAVLAERSAAGRAVAQAHAGLAEAQELAHVGSWEWDVRVDQVTWSDELYRLWGVEPSEEKITYDWYLASVHPEDRELVASMVERAFTEDMPFSFEHRVRHGEGPARWIHSRGRVVRDNAGAPVRMLGTAQDITERKRIDELRDSILSTVSHELRTPLTSILGFSITLEEKGERLDEETRSAMVTSLSQQALKLDRLLSDLLDIDRLRRGFMRPSFHETDVGSLVEHAVTAFSPGSHTIEVHADNAPAQVDAPKVERIVDNLIANAVNHTPPGTEISVRVEAQKDGVLLSVDDNGPGVAETDREAIFDLFTRRASNDFVQGTGIGLSLVSQFTALHGGRVWVEEASSGGASFRVFLPAKHPE
ncbi:MAG: MASE1 domain-containing protein [Actinobacteria bacterium]|nr:MASE1 domain-containing protein [Actinomycetota bacterium]